jgi:outer membrane protein insertion porin family
MSVINASLALLLAVAVVAQRSLDAIATGIHLRALHFVGATQLPRPEINRCAADLKRRSYGGVNWQDEIIERARILCWQQAGYFKATVHGDFKQVADSGGTHQFAVTLTVNEGSQYRLGDIAFTGSTLFSSAELRTMIPLKGGQVFNPEAIRKGIENLRRAYGQLGYINFTSVPDTEIDDGKKVITIKWDTAEGKQFRVRNVFFSGVSRERAALLSKGLRLKIGDVYDSRRLDDFYRQNRDLLPRGARVDQGTEIRTDNSAGVVDLIVHLEDPL